MLLVMACWVIAMTSGLSWAKLWTGLCVVITIIVFISTQTVVRGGYDIILPVGHWSWWVQLGVLGIMPLLLAFQRERDERRIKAMQSEEAKRMTQLSGSARSLLSLQHATRELETQIAEITDVYHVTRSTVHALHLSELFAASLEVAPKLLSAQGLRLIDLSHAEPQILRARRSPDGRMIPVPSGGGIVESETNHLLPMEKAIVQQALASGRSASATSGKLSCNFPEGLSSVAWVPLWREQRPFGVLVADDLPEGEMKMLTIVANQLSLQLSRIYLYQQVESLAVTDSLTGLFVRRYFLERTDEELTRSKRHKLACTLLMVDLDRFKDKNDTYGHLVGDVVLKDVAGLLLRNMRDIDLIGRYGGEEFVLLLVETTVEQAMPIAQRLKQMVEVHPIRAYDELLSQTISIGIAGFPDEAETLETLIERADQALYAAKRSGRNRVVSAAQLSASSEKPTRTTSE